MPELRTLLIGDEPQRWEAAGFTVVDDRTTIGSIDIRFVSETDAGDSKGIFGWELTDIEDGAIDGIASTATTAEPAPPLDHPNGVSRLDHVVLMTSNIERTTAALEAAGFSARRTRDVPGAEPPRRQVFFWAGETILELVGPVDPSGDRPASIWGLAVTTDDMDRAVSSIGERISTPKQAVQPGRMIATIDTRTLGITTAIALMTPHVPDSSPHDMAEN